MRMTPTQTAAMNIPILKLKGILLTSVQIDLTDDEAIEFQCDILEKIRDTEARGIVIDITAMEVVDSYMARILNETATMVELLGARAVITGMQPTVALTLVEMGRELIGVQTALDLEQGFDKLQELLAADEVPIDV